MKNATVRTNHSRIKIFLCILPLLLSTLACNYVAQLILPSTPTPTATITPTLTATPPPTASPTLTPEFQAACPVLMADILTAAMNTGPVLLTPRRANAEEQANQYMVSYDLKDDKLGVRSEILVPDDFEAELDQRATHEAIWDYFAALIPVSKRDFLTEFSVMTDGRSRILGGVRRINDDPEEWELRVDVLDARERHELTYTLLHEFGHLLTLRSSQVAFDRSIHQDPENEAVFERARQECPNYFSADGCSLPDSYLNEFFQRYWSPLFDEWQEIDEAKDDTSYQDMLDDFYRVYADQFLTEYAVTSPEEDMAETWAFFILAPKPELTSIANEKIRFFYEYPELVQLRQEILTRLCAEFPQ